MALKTAQFRRPPGYAAGCHKTAQASHDDGNHWSDPARKQPSFDFAQLWPSSEEEHIPAHHAPAHRVRREQLAYR